MFYLTPPLMHDAYVGNSIISNDDRTDWCLIRLCDGFTVDNLIGLWRNEADAIFRKRRLKGFLPTQIRRDRSGRLGAVRGIGIVRIKEYVYAFDEGELRQTFLQPPHVWWKCIDYRGQIAHNDLNIGPISVASFASWVDALDVLQHAKDVTIDTFRFYHACVGRNYDLVGRCIEVIAGGNELLSIFPPDCISRMECISRYGSGKQKIEINGDIGHCDFCEETYPPRDLKELIWWIDMVFQSGDMVAFLDPHGKAGKGVPIFILKPGDDVASVLPDLLEKSRIDSEAVDHVAFSACCDLPELSQCNGHAVLTKARYRHLLKGANRVLMGVCKGSTWAEFPLRENIHNFERSINRDK